MQFALWFVAATALALAVPVEARPQPGKDGRKFSGEDERIARVIDQANTSFEAERERLVTGLRRLVATNGAVAASSDEEYEGWFRALAGGKESWRCDTSTPKPLADLFNFLADRVGATDDQITRGQFLDYARQSLADDSVPSWKSVEKLASAEANKLFTELDRDRDGRLSREEMSDALRAERRQWDKDGDGFIDRAEYRAFFLNRAQKAHADATKHSEQPGSPRGGGVPSGLPAWFALLDADGDGQIGLYEWRASGWSIEDFRRLDRNGDGLLTTAEVLWAVAQAKARGTPDELLTRQLPPDFRKKGGGG